MEEAHRVGPLKICYMLLEGVERVEGRRGAAGRGREGVGHHRGSARLLLRGREGESGFE